MASAAGTTTLRTRLRRACLAFTAAASDCQFSIRSSIALWHPPVQRAHTKWMRSSREADAVMQGADDVRFSWLNNQRLELKRLKAGTFGHLLHIGLFAQSMSRAHQPPLERPGGLPVHPGACAGRDDPPCRGDTDSDRVAASAVRDSHIHRWAVGTPMSTWSTCFPQPSYVNFRHDRQTARWHMITSLDSSFDIHDIHCITTRNSGIHTLLHKQLPCADAGRDHEIES